MTERRPSPVEQITQVFSMRQRPRNVRLHDYLDDVAWARVARSAHRRLRLWALGSPLAAPRGMFIYRRGGTEREIVFDGRNLQFSSVYDQFYRAGYELETALLLAALAAGPGAFYDIGANWGHHSLLLAANDNFTGSIHAFEPNPPVFAQLCDVLRQADLTGRVEALNLGVGRVAGELVLTEHNPYLTGLAHLQTTGAGARVAVKPLDALGLPPPRLIKVDAEGMETDILAGAEQLLATTQPFVVLENFLNWGEPEKTYAVFKFLLPRGYRLFNPVLRFTIRGHTVLAGYAANFPALLAQDPHPTLALVELTLENRFLFSSHLNILAAPVGRMDELTSAGLLFLDAPGSHLPSARTDG
jgi:FkbM family methyltransferase